MKLLKIILFIAAIYFIRRFIQMYRMMKALQENEARKAADTAKQQPPKGSNAVVDADFKVLD